MTSASIRLSSPVSGVDGDVSGQQGLLDALALDLIGKRYETLDGLEPPLDSQFDNEADHQLGREVIRWLRTSM